MFQIVVREGITGGFVGPTIKRAVQIDGDESQGASIQVSDLKAGTKADYNTLGGDLMGKNKAFLSSFIPEIKDLLKTLPIEEPAGSEDIYGLDTSITFFSDDFNWQNGGPGGCGHGKSSTQATEEQKEKFKALVDLIYSTGQQFAVTAA
ncbi:unnamed protein product [Cunninghamella blakesleeana]